MFLQWADCPDLPETWRVLMSPFCEQMGLGECMLWNSADARESMTFKNSISSSIIQFIVSLILSHNCWFIGLFIQRNHVLFRVLVYLHVGKSLVPGRSFVSADSVKESFNLLISSLVRFSELQRSFLDEEEWLYYFIFLGGWFPFLNFKRPFILFSWQSTTEYVFWGILFSN